MRTVQQILTSIDMLNKLFDAGTIDGSTYETRLEQLQNELATVQDKGSIVQSSINDTPAPSSAIDAARESITKDRQL